jgi:hypothetical protein
MDVAIVILTGALVLTTAVYSYFTWRMADETRKTREQTLRPRLGLYVRAYGPMGGHVALRSLGPGTALDVLVTLSFEPSGETREWRTPVFPPGDEAEFFFPKDEAERIPDLKQLEEHGIQVRVRGAMRDVTGTSYDVSEQLDAATWAKVLVEAHQVYVKTPADTVASETKKIRETLEKIRRALEKKLLSTPS